MRAQRLNSDQIDRILELSKTEPSMYVIANSIPCKYSSVKYWLLKNGIDGKVRPTVGYKQLSDEEKSEAIKMYSSGNYNRTDIAKKFGISEPNMRSIVMKSGLHNRTTRVGTHRRHSFNENYFETIDTPSKAYLLGFYYADGNVEQRCYSAGIGLASVDEELLDFLKTEIGHPGEIRRVKGRINKRSGNMQQDAVHFDVSSKIYCRHLINNGVVPRKSLILMPPTTIPDEYIHHFILGYFDGDGCICISSPKRPQYGVTIIGTKEVLEFIQHHVCKHTGMPEKTINRHNNKSVNTFRIEWRGRPSCLKMKEYMYRDAPFSLTRKRNKFNLVPIEL